MAVAGVLLFLLIVVVEHLANVSLNPATHEISEYVHGRLGWLMTCGFAVWAGSLGITGMVTTGVPRGRPPSIALVVAALGMGITACFATQTSAGRLPHGVMLNSSGRLHDIGSGLATVALVAAVLLSLRLRDTRHLRGVTIGLLAIAVPVDIVLLVVGSEVAGIRQRLLVVIACIWQLTLLASRS